MSSDQIGQLSIGDREKERVMAALSRRSFLASAALTGLDGLLMSCGASVGPTSGATAAPTTDAAAAPTSGATAAPTRDTSSGTILAVAHSNKPRQDAPTLAPGELWVFAAGHNAFGFDLYRQLRADSGNLFFSPYSIAQVLTMISAGARGQTLQQMAQTLHSALPQERLHRAANGLDQELVGRSAQQDGFQLESANSIWGQRGDTFLPEFLDVLAIHYGAGLRLLDFRAASEGARTIINDTIAQQTHDKIKDVLPPGSIDPETRLVLANAIYFNAKWDSAFAKDGTQDGPFNPDTSGPLMVPMMTQLTNIPYMAGRGYQAIKLAYRGGVSMLVLLPDAGQLAAFEATLDNALLKSILDGLSGRAVALTMPKFVYHSGGISLNDRLCALGMVEPFDQETVDFSGIDGKRDLYISHAIHTAMVRVDEGTTEATAATIVGLPPNHGPVEAEPPLPLAIDRPFVFLIRDDATHALLFMGRIVNPTPV
jgi:serpin B